MSFVKTILKTAGLVASLFLMANIACADDAIPAPSQLFFPNVNTVAGNPNGKVTIVEFFDYNCEYCHKVPALFNRLTSKNSNIRIVYRDYPVLGPGSVIAARAAVAAAEQGKYSALHDALFSTNQPLNDKTVYSLAANLGVDTDKLSRDIDSRGVEQQLRLTAQAANRLQLNGVPVVVVASTPSKDQKTVNAYVLTAPSYSELQDAVKKVSAMG